MVPTNDFIPFCPTDTGTNLLSESDYIAAADRVSGNKPGIASAKLNNKALRQGTAIAAGAAGLLSNILGADVIDDGVTAKILAQFFGALKPYAPKLTKLTSGTGTFNSTYIFQVASANATATATYTNNGHTYTVAATIAGATELYASGPGVPSVSGTLTKSGGTGDSTITFYAVRAPISMEVEMVGGGGGGGGSGISSGTAGTSGGDTTFGPMTASGGANGTQGANGAGGGGASLGSGPVGIAIAGSNSIGSSTQGTAATGASMAYILGGCGASSAFGGGGFGAGQGSDSGGGASTNSGSGGGGAGAQSVSNAETGPGGASGGYIKAQFLGATLATSTWSYGVGAGGAGQLAGSGSGAGHGGAGGAGLILVTERYQ